MSGTFFGAPVAAPSFAARRSIWVDRFRRVPLPTSRKPSSCPTLASIRQHQRTPTDGIVFSCFPVPCVDSSSFFMEAPEP